MNKHLKELKQKIEVQLFSAKWNNVNFLLDKLDEMLQCLNEVSGKIKDNEVFVEIRRIYIVLTEIAYRIRSIAEKLPIDIEQETRETYLEVLLDLLKPATSRGGREA